MKIPLITCLLISLPCLAAEDKGELELDLKIVEQHSQDKEKTRTFRFASAALKFIEGAEKIAVFEGLPHQNQEWELLEQERAIVNEEKIGGFDFYPRSQDLNKEDEPALKELLRVNGNGISPFLHLKFCGGFHPDYAVRFTKGEDYCDLLLCFGCGDAQILHNGKVIHAHFYGKAWREILAGYTKHRPKPEK